MAIELRTRLAALLGLGDDPDDVQDTLDHLLEIESDEDLQEYLSQLLGGTAADDDVRKLVDDICRFRKGEALSVAEANNAEGADAKRRQEIDERKKEKEREEQARRRQQEQEELERTERERRRREQEKADEERRQKEKQRKMEEEARKRKQKEEMEAAARAAKQRQAKQRESRVRKSAKKGSTAPSLAPPPASTTDPGASKNENREEVPRPPQRGEASVVCGCYGTKHKSLTNCLHCGRIACEREGFGYCPFCGFLIEKFTLPQQQGGGASLDKALLHKERLLRFDREFARRTVVFDDQADYFSNTTSAWLTEEEQLNAEDQDIERRKQIHERKKQVLNIAFE